MARPIKTTAEHFKHPKDFRNHLALKAIRQRFGIEGYAIVVMTMEFLMGVENMVVELDEIQLELMAADFQTTTETLLGVIRYACKLGVFRTENNQEIEFSAGKTYRLFSPLLIEVLRDLMLFRAKERTRKSETTTENPKGNPEKESFPHGKPHSKPHSIVEYSKDIYLDREIPSEVTDSPEEPLPSERSEEPKSTVPPPTTQTTPPEALLESPKEQPASAPMLGSKDAQELVLFCRKLPTLGKAKYPLSVEQADTLLLEYSLQTVKDVAEKFDAHESAAKWQSPFPQLKVWLKNEQMQSRTAPAFGSRQGTPPPTAKLGITQAPAGFLPRQVTVQQH